MVVKWKVVNAQYKQWIVKYIVKIRKARLLPILFNKILSKIKRELTV